VVKDEGYDAERRREGNVDSGAEVSAGSVPCEVHIAERACLREVAN
jgi:hypothetical protein